MKLTFAAVTLAITCLAVSAEPLPLVTGNDYAPFADQKLPEGGMTVELVKAALKESKVEFAIHWQPWARGLHETRSGKFAATFPYLKTPEREQDFLYSRPIYAIEDWLFAKPNAGLDPNNLGSLEGKKICLPLGWAPAAKLVPMIKSGAIKQEQPKDISTCVRMVSAGRADFFVTDQFQGSAAIAGTGVTNVTKSSYSVGSAALYLITSKSFSQGKSLIDAFNQGLAALKKSGEFDRIVAKHTK
ncbi:ABC transporter substrate-binding protein [Chitinimonas sp. BJYL2]|uniref:substrate-binding periplasmic protein n=1 Tax=Chitinimonas sp. BJYL2 TaxID=2976696 RepID=UPI0022B2FE9C|nr:transporter substrate-binding domain-containing protein [Chitinimonas sp. BJYL2]